jgi:hypothetical protein
MNQQQGESAQPTLPAPLARLEMDNVAGAIGFSQVLK